MKREIKVRAWVEPRYTSRFVFHAVMIGKKGEQAWEVTSFTTRQSARNRAAEINRVLR